MAGELAKVPGAITAGLLEDVLTAGRATRARAGRLPTNAYIVTITATATHTTLTTMPTATCGFHFICLSAR